MGDEIMKNETLFKILGGLLGAALLLSFIGFPTGSSAQDSYNLHVADVDACNNFGSDPAILGNTEIKINYIDMSYDPSSQTFEIEVEADNSRGKLANAFHFGVSDGPMPEGEGAIAHVYFDASDINNTKASVYAYNGRGDNVCASFGASWEYSDYGQNFAADPILSSVSSPSAVLESSASETISGGTITRVYRLILDATAINSHYPFVFGLPGTYTYDYEGLKFGDNAGLWFWAGENVSTSYNGSGYLTAFNTSICAICDQADFETVKKPVCSGVTVTQESILTGNPTQINISVQDPDILTDIEQNDIKVNYNIPPGASVSVPENGIVSLNGAGIGTVTIDWTPNETQVGSHQIGASFVKGDYGLGQEASEVCQTTVTVNPILPSCKEAKLETITQADQDLGRAANLIKAIRGKIKKVLKEHKGSRKANKILENKLDPVAVYAEAGNTNRHDTYLIGWQAFNSMVSGLNNGFFQCSDINSCEGLRITSFDSQIANFALSVDGLKEIATTRIQQLKRRIKLYKKFLKKKKGYSKAQIQEATSKYSKFARKQEPKVVDRATSANDQFNTHVSTYGNQSISCSNAEVVE